jgi:hypothetical protein
MTNMETINTDLQSVHPIGNEIRHDDATTELFRVAAQLAQARIKNLDSEDNIYKNLQQFMINYVGDPDMQGRKGFHELPGSKRQTKHGERNYTLGCSAMYDPLRREICCIRKDPNHHNQHTSDWLVIRYNVVTSELVEETVLPPVKTIQGLEDSIILEIAPDVSYHGSYKLQFSVDPNYNTNGKPLTYSHQKYYGRGTGTDPESTTDRFYSDDISVLIEAIEYESKQKLTKLDEVRTIGEFALL